MVDCQRGYAERPRWVRYLIHGFMAFVFFNATIVFESGFIRWAGVVVMLLLLRRLAMETVPSSKFQVPSC